jgi:hypothetical protein
MTKTPIPLARQDATWVVPRPFFERGMFGIGTDLIDPETRLPSRLIGKKKRIKGGIVQRSSL